MGYKLYGSLGTADYFRENKIQVESIEWMFGNLGDDIQISKMSEQVKNKIDETRMRSCLVTYCIYLFRLGGQHGRLSEPQAL